MVQDNYYELTYNSSTMNYEFTNATNATINARRLWFLSSFFHKVGNWFRNGFHKVKTFFDT